MNTTTRPRLLWSALSLSTLGSGISAIAYLGAAIFYQPTLKLITHFTNLLATEGLSRLYFVVLAGFSLLSVTAVLSLWKNKRHGYFLYLFAQIALWAMPLIYLGTNAFSSTNTIFTVLFIAIYSRFYRQYQ